LNVVPPASKAVALGQVIDGDKVMSLPTQVTHAADLDVAPGAVVRESRTQRVRRLQAEARELAAEHISEFETLLDATAKMAIEIADGGEVYSVGAREICRRLAEELPRTLQTLRVITKKTTNFAEAIKKRV
jgi:DNA-directed RNA polymerase subunit F